MMRLFSAELRKVWQSRFFLLSFAVLLAVNLFLLWFGTGHTPSSAPSQAYRTLTQQLSGMTMQEMDTFLHEELARAEALTHIDGIVRMEAYNNGKKDEQMRETYAADFEQYGDLYQTGDFLKYSETLSAEYRFLNGIVLEFEQVNGYEEFLDSIEQKAKQLSGISIFAESESGYDMENIRVTDEAFKGMRGTPIHYYPQKGLMTALDFELTDVVSVFAMLLIATVLVRAERDNGLLALIRSTPSGRLPTAAAKLAALAVSLAVVLIGMYGVNLLYCGSLYGLGPLERTIQSVPALMRSTWKLTVGRYLFFFLLTKWLAAFICGVWVMLAMLFAKRLFNGVLGALGFIALHLLIRAVIPATSRLNVIKYANLVSLLRTNELLGGYRNLYWFDQPIPLLLVESVAAVLFAVVFVAAFLALFSRYYFTAAGRRTSRLTLRRKLPTFTTPMRQEAYKLLVMQGTALLLVLFAGFQVYTAVTTESYIDANEIYYQYYMKHVQGPMTQEKVDWLNEQNKEFEPIHRLNAALSANEIGGQEYQMMMQAYGGLQQKMMVFQNVVSKAQMLSEKSGSEMVYETGWLKLFDTQDRQDLQDSLWLALLCAVSFSGLFAMEQQTGMIKVISTTPLGKRFTVRCKLILTLVCSAGFALLGVLPRFWVTIRDYGLGTWLAPVYSIPDYAAAPGIPLFLMAALLVFSRFLAVFCMAVVTLALSQRIGNTFGAMFLSLALFSFAPLLSLSGLTAAKWYSIYLPVHVCAMLSQPGGMVLCIFMLLILSGICYLSIEYLQRDFGSVRGRKT